MNFMDLGAVIAANLKRIRASRNLTLGQLSKISGISKAMLSEIEKGGSNPTVNTVLKIADGLNVPYTSLMEQNDGAADLVTRADAVMQIGESEHYRAYCYFPVAANRNFELFYIELDAGASNVSIGHPPRAQEYVYVMKGCVRIKTPSGTYEVGAGDALMFESSAEHTYINDGSEKAEFNVINYYPE